MPQGRPAPGTPQDWLARARSDLAIARLPLPAGACYEDLCFHAQQAAEKALKAVYQYHGWTFRYTHDLEELVTGLERQGLVVPSDTAQQVAFEYQGPTQVHANGNNVAWKCPTCGHPILFVYQNGRMGSGPQDSVQCPTCRAGYYLKPPYGSRHEPPRGQPMAPARRMTIVQVGGPLP